MKSSGILSHMRSLDFDYLIKGLFLLVVYYITAKVGLGLSAVAGFSTLVWFPTGISIAFLFLFGRRFWPFVFLGAFFANFTTGASIPVALGIGIGNSLEAFISAFFLKQYIRFRPAFDRLKQVAGFILVVMLATLISASIGTISLLLGNEISISSFGITWTSWWIGDAVSALLVAPLIIIWSRFYKTSFNFERALEFSIPVIILIFVCVAVFKGTPIGSGDLIKYLVYPPLIWISISFSPRITITTIFVLTILAITATFSGQSPFATYSLINGLIYLQSFIAITGSTMLLLSAATAENRYLQKRKDEFISVASHELKTPLTSLKLGIQLLQGKLEKKHDLESLMQIRKINDQADRTIRLAVNLLDTKSLNDGKIQFRKQNFVLCDLVKEVINEVSWSTKRKIQFSKVNNIEVYADKDKVGQVLVNLLVNADKYSPKSKKIVVSSLKNKNEVLIKVQDFGDGVDPEDKKAIFKSYYRVNKQTSTKDLSMGLGLYISKKIIEGHDGKIWVESPVLQGRKKIEGSCFCFSLPVS